MSPFWGASLYRKSLYKAGNNYTRDIYGNEEGSGQEDIETKA